MNHADSLIDNLASRGQARERAPVNRLDGRRGRGAGGAPRGTALAGAYPRARGSVRTRGASDNFAGSFFLSYSVRVLDFLSDFP